jgi:hypothetical protein
MELFYIFHEDGGHGWLQVPLEELQELNIDDQISSYSYVDDDYVYLEEDQDMSIFLKVRCNGIPANIQNFLNHSIINHYSEWSDIRNYPRYIQSK